MMVIIVFSEDSLSEGKYKCTDSLIELKEQ